MKFTDGQWLLREKHSILNPKQAFDACFLDGKLTVYVYTKEIEDRAQTLDQGTFTLHFTSDLHDTIQVQINHFEGLRKHGPEFICFHEDSVEPEFWEEEESYHYRSGKLEAVIQKAPFSLEYYYEGKQITKSESKAIANIKNEKDEVYTREQLTLSVGEYVYGLGERFTPFIKNGQAVDIWNEDGGTSSELSYKNIPFYITNKNYGVFVKHLEKVSFEVASEQAERVQFSVAGEQLSYVMIGGTSMKEVLQNYTRLMGTPSLPPAWTFGLWLSTSFTTNYDEEMVTSLIDGMEERQIPLHVFHFDCFWMKECEWCNFKWDSKTFQDPVGMLRRMKAKKLKICVWINPYIAQKSPLFQEGMKNHYLVEYANGDVWQWDRWQAGMGLVDFTNPEAYEWYQEKLEKLIDMGVDCFKTDFGERIPTNVVYYDGSDPIKMHNYYTYLYNQCVFELLERKFGKKKAAVFARSATAGSQKFPVHWGGDCWATYESMAETLRGGLSLCMSGFGFWSHDISGFEKTAPPDIYKRWVAFGLLSTHSRLHGSTSYRVPWLFDEESVLVLKFFTQLKCKLMPYLWSEAIQTAKTGIPMLRTMVLEFQDPACRFLDTQYMLGEKLLVAPVFSKEGEVTYYLPKGKWVDLLTGNCKEGGTYYEESCDYFHLPLYARPNTIIPIGNNEQEVEYDFAKNVTLHVMPLEDGKKADCQIYNTEEEVMLHLTIARENDTYTINIRKAIHPFSVLFHTLHTIIDCECQVSLISEGLLVSIEEQREEISLVAKE
ncbi:alpha-xylosidase [Konateibacter massiliensis]|uniref:alpha-xylosidase n=1 Tax=Konateibacter massiliensis TaxID=2002841 RepID=UPI000C159CE0|nr:alpha-xylosidase [Konateibacter massiliensis]